MSWLASECTLQVTNFHLSVMKTCLCIGMAGAFGGLTGGMYRRLTEMVPCPDAKKDYVCFLLCGAVSAFAAMVICKWLGLVFDNPNPMSRVLYTIGVSMLAGFFAMRILPHIGGVIDDKFKQLHDELAENRKQFARTLKDFSDYNRVVGRAEVALATNAKSDYLESISCIESVLEKFKHRRTINIYYGRLLRRVERYDDAIKALQNFINNLLEAKKQFGLIDNDKKAVAAAYFNIACYKWIKYRSGELTETMLEDLKSTLKKAASYNHECATSWKTDDDLKSLVEKYPSFSID